MENLYSWALKDNGFDELYVKPSSINGKGLFSYKNLPANTILYQISDDYLNDGSSGLLYAIALVQGEPPYLKPDNILQYTNHSCKPNTILSRWGTLINKEFIFGDTEITIDYLSIIKNNDFEMCCSCGSENCRTIIRSYKQVAV